MVNQNAFSDVSIYLWMGLDELCSFSLVEISFNSKFYLPGPFATDILGEYQEYQVCVFPRVFKGFQGF